jgi:hypothetical protein
MSQPLQNQIGKKISVALILEPGDREMEYDFYCIIQIGIIKE